jgi:hypothetical protein
MVSLAGDNGWRLEIAWHCPRQGDIESKEIRPMEISIMMCRVEKSRTGQDRTGQDRTFAEKISVWIYR